MIILLSLILSTVLWADQGPGDATIDLDDMREAQAQRFAQAQALQPLTREYRCLRLLDPNGDGGPVRGFSPPDNFGLFRTLIARGGYFPIGRDPKFLILDDGRTYRLDTSHVPTENSTVPENHAGWPSYEMRFRKNEPRS